MKLTFILLIVLFTFGCNLRFNQASFYLPSDAEMERNFLKNEVAFNRLVEMIGVEDSSVSFVSKQKKKSSWVDEKIADERWMEYQQLFEQTGARFGIHRFDNFDGQKPITFFISSRDLSGQWNKNQYDEFFTGDKGYAYSKDELKPQVDSLDYISDAQIKKNQFLFKKIKENWYIYYTLGVSKPE
jgi:hypothetical protein